MQRLRTLPEAINELKAQDPDTAFTLWALRRLIAEGEIPAVRSGKKQLVSIEAIEQYVNSKLGGVNGKKLIEKCGKANS